MEKGTKDHLVMSLSVIINEIGVGNRAEDLQMLLNAGAKVYLFDVAHQDEDFVNTLLKIQNGCTRNPNSAIIISITGRHPKIGCFAHSKPELQLKKSSQIILTADRRISTRGTRIAVYANCQEYLSIVQAGHLIWIGDKTQLSVIEVVRDSFVCTVQRTGSIKPGDNVYFLISVNNDCVTSEEQQDIAMAINCKASALLLPAASSTEYLQSLRNHLQKIDSGHVKLFVNCSSASVPTLDTADFIANTYDGIIYTFCNRYCANVRENIEPTEAERHLLQQCHEMRKPIILKLNPTKEEDIVWPDLVEPALKCLLYYPDGFVIPANVKLRQSFGNLLFRDNENTNAMNWLELNRKIMSSTSELSVLQTLCMNAAIASYYLKPKAILMISYTGSTAIELSNYRPACRIVAVTQNEHVAANLLLHKNCDVAVYQNQTNKTQSNACERRRMLLCGLKYVLYSKIAELNDPIIMLYRSDTNLTYCDEFTSMLVTDFKTIWSDDVGGLIK